MKNTISLFILVLFFVSCQAQNNNVKTVVEGNSRFAFDLYAKVKEDKNIFFSPFSISSALSMTYAGAANKTEAEMREVLYFKENNDKFHKEFSEILKKVEVKTKDKASPQISIANKLYAQKDYKFKDDFLSIPKKYYNSELQKVDFKDEKNRDEARKEINSWVEKNTNNKIQELIAPNILSDLTRLVLVNALYFKAPWQTFFKEEKTSKKEFWTDEKNSTKVDFMQGIYKSAYFQNDMLQIAVLPYKDNVASLIIFLPKEKNGFSEFQKEFTYENYTKWMSKTVSKKIAFSIPKFKIEDNYRLKDVFQKMGMKAPFSRKADFSGMTGNKELKISKIIHKSFIEIDEKGTEAAAATAVVMNRKNGNSGLPVSFKADHSFIFIIKDNRTNSILFMGHVIKP